MTTDNETLLGKLISGASHLLNRKAVHTLIQCTDCGEYKKQGDNTPCGHHLPLSEMQEGDQLVRISLVEAKPESRDVERLATEPLGITGEVVRTEPFRSSDSFKRADLLEAEEELQASTGDKPVYRRKQETPSTWGMSTEDLNRKMDERESGIDPDNKTYI